ncbi:DUF1302 domain-containing protein [Sinimarinibacterium thermocellulolyticum]|uniref:DUF1302 family protein n=1 Tax=Sinimarinibacterium thermocellulolyticum TaxID=3170016 RepID=A0ABV2A6Z7_9GAMM
MNTQRRLRRVAAAALILVGADASALSFEFGDLDGSPVEGVLNTTMTLGAAMRMQDRSRSLVGKVNLDPDACGRLADGTLFYQSCQGLFRTQTHPAQKLVAAPGQFTMNADDGNLNYDCHDLTQAPFKITQDLTLTWGSYGFFAKGLYFYDFVNEDFIEYHPNRITPENLLEVGNVSTVGTELVPLPLPVLGVRNDSRACPPQRRPGAGPCGLVYGRGGVVRSRRDDPATLEQIGSDLQLLDLYFYGSLPLPGERELAFKIGRQAINWGESTYLAFDSINTVNPINANNFLRVGSQVEEVFQPVGMVSLSSSPFYNATMEVFYQFEWLPTEAPPPGSYLSFLDIGTDNAVNHVNLSFAYAAEDPDGVGLLLDNPLSGVTNTAATAQRLPDREPRDGGQYGVSLRYYAEELNNGTEFGFYYTHTHSRNPYVSMYAVAEGCGKQATNTVAFMLACIDVPLFHALLRGTNDPLGASDDAVNFDALKIQVEYPENIDMFGMSFNTTAGPLSLQGEIAFRPDMPMQVDVEDLAFADFGPTLTNCHLPEAGCAGSGSVTGIVTGLLPQPLENALAGLVGALAQAGLPLDQLGGIGTFADPAACAQLAGGIVRVPGTNTCLYPSSDFVVDADGTPGPFRDSFDLIVGHAVGSGRSFPSFVVPYRGEVIGTNPGGGYIRGWEYFDSFQFNFGGTYVAGATENPIGADQVILIFETGATWVPDLPPLDVLQLEAPGTYLHASAGADGSGADRSRQACSTNQACSYGVDGLRFNPHQQDLGGFPDKLSYGYVLISQISYESVLSGISVRPFLFWKHDVEGTAPGLAGNFVAGRKQASILVETRYKYALSLSLGYTWFTGGGDYNLNRDRDFAQAFIKYQF